MLMPSCPSGYTRSMILLEHARNKAKPAISQFGDAIAIRAGNDIKSEMNIRSSSPAYQ